MLEVSFVSQCKKDYKRCSKRHYDMNEFWDVVNMLANFQKLDEKYNDHNLKGDFVDKRECHIRPDWLLIYRIEGNRLMLYRTGSHGELFG